MTCEYFIFKGQDKLMITELEHRISNTITCTIQVNEENSEEVVYNTAVVGGATGGQGAQGATGNQGATGIIGAQGATGVVGAQGTTGSTGPNGAPGPVGPVGAPGAQGTTGSTGPTGGPGPTGSPGAQGTTGTTGPTGGPGPTGSPGSPGPQGTTGSTGPTGGPGPTGPPGAQGTTGGFTTSSDAQINSLGVNTPAPGIAGEIRATGNIIAFFSDGRLKKDVVEIESALELIEQIRGVRFNWTEEAEAMAPSRVGKREVGVIAQEIEAVMPEVIAEWGEYKTVLYDRLVPLLIQGIKELKIEVDLLKKK
jgi:hypothetical protein